MANPLRKMATVRKISSIHQIDGADRIERAVVDGWDVVVERDAWHEGDYCVYMEPDTFLPASDPRYTFLMERGTKEMMVNNVMVTGHVLRTIRLRGVYSAGILFHLSEVLPTIPEVAWQSLYEKNYNVSKMCGVWEYVAVASPGQFEFLGKYDTYVAPRTDAERAQNVHQDVFDLLKKTDYYVSVKVDGTSMTICKDIRDDELKIYSHNNRLKLDEGMGLTSFNAANKEGLVDFCEQNPGITLQYELAGTKIGGNRLGLNGHHCFVFSAYDMQQRKYLDPYELIWNFGSHELRQHVTPKMRLNLNDLATPTDLLEFADKMRSYVTKDRLDEGLVVHCMGRGDWSEEEWPSVEMKLRDALGATMQLKAVSRPYLAKAKG